MLEQLYLKELLHLVAQGLLWPTVIVLLVLIVYALWCIGSIIVEVVVERRHYKVQMPDLVSKLDASQYEQIDGVVEESGLLRSQKNMLKTLSAYGYLPEEARVSLAKRLLADEEFRYEKVVSRTDLVAKIAPMLGLMGTLIPLGPGIQSMGQGQLDELASSIGIAFDTTIAGLVVAAVALVVSRFRKRWYEDYMVSSETAMSTILEKARACKAAGQDIGSAEKATKAMEQIALSKGRGAVTARAAQAAADEAVRKAAQDGAPVPPKDALDLQGAEQDTGPQDAGTEEAGD